MGLPAVSTKADLILDNKIALLKKDKQVKTAADAVKVGTFKYKQALNAKINNLVTEIEGKCKAAEVLEEKIPKECKRLTAIIDHHKKGFELAGYTTTVSDDGDGDGTVCLSWGADRNKRALRIYELAGALDSIKRGYPFEAHNSAARVKKFDIEIHFELHANIKGRNNRSGGYACVDILLTQAEITGTAKELTTLVVEVYTLLEEYTTLKKQLAEMPAIKEEMDAILAEQNLVGDEDGAEAMRAVAAFLADKMSDIKTQAKITAKPKPKTAKTTKRKTR